MRVNKKYLVVATISAVILAWGCGNAKLSPNEMKHISFKAPGVPPSFIYSQDGFTYFEECATTDVVVSPAVGEGKFCKLLKSKVSSMELDGYKKGLAIAFDVDINIISMGAKAYEQEIADLEARKKLETDLGKLEMIKNRLLKFQSNGSTIEKVMHFVDKLSDEKDPVALDMEFDAEDVKKIISPFASRKISDGYRWKANPQTGLVYIEESNICGYDVMGIRRKETCIESAHISESPLRFTREPTRYRFDEGLYHNTSTREVQALLVDDVQKVEVKAGCRQKYGKGWSVASKKQMELINKLDATKFPVFTNDGIFYVDKNERDTQIVSEPNSRFNELERVYFKRSNEFYGEHYDHRSLSVTAYCVARAKDVDLYGDVDGDGIPNVRDRCNYLPENQDDLADVAKSGRRRGCASGQALDIKLDYIVSSGQDRLEFIEDFVADLRTSSSLQAYLLSRDDLWLSLRKLVETYSPKVVTPAKFTELLLNNPAFSKDLVSAFSSDKELVEYIDTEMSLEDPKASSGDMSVSEMVWRLTAKFDVLVGASKLPKTKAYLASKGIVSEDQIKDYWDNYFSALKQVIHDALSAKPDLREEIQRYLRQ